MAVKTQTACLIILISSISINQKVNYCFCALRNFQFGATLGESINNRTKNLTYKSYSMYMYFSKHAKIKICRILRCFNAKLLFKHEISFRSQHFSNFRVVRAWLLRQFCSYQIPPPLSNFIPLYPTTLQHNVPQTQNVLGLTDQQN